ncbi:thioredoxin [Cyclopterus lumpus]|uniref:Thioredoxin n=1 Tax=Cyclopterus lumpus TaxID=8103 RepID=A0A8C2XC45_CYCLU|nr:thioredoxin [Cyclopterus lumpus]
MREPTDLAEFRQILKEAGDKLVVVDFTATWCGPCKMIGPLFAQQETKPENANVIFLKVDVDEADDISKECKISCMPTFQYYKNGVKVFEFSGANIDTLIENLEIHRT